HVRRDEGRRRHAEKVLGEFLLVHELRAWHAHQLDADAHEPDVVDVGRDVRSRAGKTYPCPKTLRLGKYAATHRLRQAVVDDEFAAHDAVRLVVPSPLETTRLPEVAHVRLEAWKDRSDVHSLVRDKAFFGCAKSCLGA